MENMWPRKKVGEKNHRQVAGIMLILSDIDISSDRWYRFFPSVASIDKSFNAHHYFLKSLRP